MKLDRVETPPEVPAECSFQIGPRSHIPGTDMPQDKTQPEAGALEGLNRQTELISSHASELTPQALLM